MSNAWFRGGGVPTLAGVKNSSRRFDQGRRQVGRVLAAMRDGAFLQLHYEQGRPIWRLSSGPLVPPTVAGIVTAKDAIVALGDGLFVNGPSQTWCYCDQPAAQTPPTNERTSR